jgi:hypothetical protein
MRKGAFGGASVLAIILALGSGPLTATQRTDVFVLGSIGSVDGFRFRTLDRVNRAISPDVMVLEVTPDEPDNRRGTKGRPEYPGCMADGPRGVAPAFHGMGYTQVEDDQNWIAVDTRR